MILFNNWVIAQEKKIAYGNYSGEITYVHSNQIEIDHGITFEIDDTLKSFVNENTRYRIYYRYNKETSVGKIDSIEMEWLKLKNFQILPIYFFFNSQKFHFIKYLKINNFFHFPKKNIC